MLFIFKCFLKQCSIVSLLVILSSHSAISAEFTEPTKPLTLEVALDLALRSNPEIAIALREQEAIGGTRVQAAVRPNPSLSTSIQDVRSDTRQWFFQLNQEIELGNKREARIETANDLYKIALAKLENKRALIHANVVHAFYAVLVAQERLKLSKSSLGIANEALNASIKRVSAGKSSPVEETKSRIAQSSAKLELNHATSQLSNARKRLSTLWGNSSPVFKLADGDVETIPLVLNLADLTASLESAPAISLAKLEISAREGMTKVERSKSTPNITVSAGVVNNQELGLNQALLGLSVPIPLFDRNQGNLQEAVSRQYQAQDKLTALKIQLSTKLAEAYARLSVAKQSVVSLREEILPGAQSAFDAAKKGFSAGKFNFLDVLDAQRTLFQVKSQYTQALLDAHMAVAEIEHVLGDVVTHSAQQAKE